MSDSNNGPVDITGLVLVDLQSQDRAEALDELIEVCVDNINAYSDWETNYRWMSEDACQSKLHAWQWMLANLNNIKRKEK